MYLCTCIPHCLHEHIVFNHSSNAEYLFLWIQQKTRKTEQADLCNPMFEISDGCPNSLVYSLDLEFTAKSSDTVSPPAKID